MLVLTCRMNARYTHGNRVVLCAFNVITSVFNERDVQIAHTQELTMDALTLTHTTRRPSRMHYIPDSWDVQSHVAVRPIKGY
jgi:hypothetical protein